MEHTTASFEVPELEKFWPRRKRDMLATKKEWPSIRWERFRSESWHRKLTHYYA